MRATVFNKYIAYIIPVYPTLSETFIIREINALLEHDVQGVNSLRKMDFAGIYILILPPSIEEMTKRLHKRATENEENIERRIKTGKEEIKNYKKYDYVITNFEVEETNEGQWNYSKSKYTAICIVY